jgi:hypothetical protein
MRIQLQHEDLLKVEHPARKPGYPLRWADRRLLDIKVLSPRKEDYVEIYRPGGFLLAVLIKQCLDADLCKKTYELLRTVDGEPSNRPGIIGEGARQADIRKDGSVSPRTGKVPKAILEAYGGKADMLGHYYYRQPAKCGPTSWTLRKPALYGQSLELVKEINDVYKTYLPKEHTHQMEYVNLVEKDFKIENTAFTTLYVLKNAPTATHVDTFDYPEAFGVMATLGDFEGGAICFPRFRIAIDYRPGDVLLADVHQLHGNFPVLSGERVACVLFVRKDIHKCPVLQDTKEPGILIGSADSDREDSGPRTTEPLPFNYTPNFLTREEANELVAYFETQAFHVRPNPRNPNNPKYNIKRQSLGYIASNAFNDRDPKEWRTEYADIDTAPEILQRFRAKLSAHVDKDVNYISILKYPDGNAHIDWHQHGEDRWHDSPVWDVSVGPTERMFWAREIDKPKTEVSVLGEVGSLITLPSSMNTTHQHAIRKDKTTSVRYSINCKSLPLTGVWDCHAGKRYPADAVYVGCRVLGRDGKVIREGTPFGNGANPLVSHDGAFESEEEFREYAERKMQNAGFRAKVQELRGKYLLCWCVQKGPKRAAFCHARVWLEIANRETPQDATA